MLGWAALGLGLEVYPFSSWRFQGPDSRFGKVFARYGCWGIQFHQLLGTSNTWRPRNQARVGFDYWKAVNVNETGRLWWTEIWNGLYWQSSNDFSDRYDSVIFANSIRLGIRKRGKGVISTITPYLAVESSRTNMITGYFELCASFHKRNPNPCDFYWENRLLAGGGLRFGASLGVARK